MERMQDLYPSSQRNATTGKSELIPWDTATIAALKAIRTYDSFSVCAGIAPGRTERVVSLNDRLFKWHLTCALTADDQLVIIPDDRNMLVTTALAANLNGRWLAVPGQTIDLALPFTYATADAATLYTMPTGANMHLAPGYWEVITGLTGGSSSAIGLSSDQSGHTTKGDLLGGSGGDVTATLGAAADYIEGTVGADIAAGVILKAGKLVRFDRVTSAFTVGAGNAHVCGVLRSNDGA